MPSPSGPPPAAPAPADPASLARRDAIHRALLAGLLSNLGVRGDANPAEYQSARGGRFHLFPGSVLYRQGPRWVMAAELVETTRLYARTVAKVQPEWAERAAPHLIKREYFDPHWDSATAHVRAFEKVTLYGLVLVARRRVHFGPIDPKTAREMFIRHALVEGDYRTGAPFFRHNRDLILRVEGLEAKARRRDLLADARARFDFYAARVPEGVFNGPLFERWRRDAERKNPELLFMRDADALRGDASEITPERHPDALTVNGLRLPLSYRLDPGGEADGVTVTIPLAALNQLPPGPFEWLVPGYLKEKIVALIKTLPKPLRVSFVPAPQYADDALASMPADARRGPLLTTLAAHLGVRAGVSIPPDAWRPDELPPDLRMNFRVADPAGKVLAAGRDLAALRARLSAEAAETFADLPESRLNRAGITAWDFGDLPDRVDVTRQGMTLPGYPGVVDMGDAVAVRLFDAPDKARAASRSGVRRLFVLQLPDEMRRVRHVIANHPAWPAMCLHYAPLGSGEDLRRQLAELTADRVFLGDPRSPTAEAPPVRTAMEFELRLRGHRLRLEEGAHAAVAAVGPILAAYHEAAYALGGKLPPVWAPILDDVRDQMAHLVPKGFLLTTPYAWLLQYPRYLKAVVLRLRRLAHAGFNRDLKLMGQITPLWQRYLARRDQHRAQGVIDPALEAYRWMVEEFRVSLFAQELGAVTAVSLKRLNTQWAAVRN